MPEVIYSEMSAHSQVAGDVFKERERQTALLRRGIIPFDCADPDSDGPKLGVLGEEFGEVCKAFIEGEDEMALYEELVQTAAVACAWAESLRKKWARDL